MSELTTAQKKALHHCAACGHLLDSHHGDEYGCASCRLDLPSDDVCRYQPRYITTTYAEVAALIDAEAIRSAIRALMAATAAGHGSGAA